MAIPDQDVVKILIEGEEFSAWPSIDIVRGVDSMAAIEFTAPFEADRAEFRELFRPFTFKDVEVRVTPGEEQGTSAGTLAAAVGAVDEILGNLDASTIFKGTLVGVSPVSDPSSSTVSVTAYSLPGVLQDCTAPGSALPIEFAGLKLDVIAKAVGDAFGIDVLFDANPGAVFDKVKLDVEQKLFDFLSNLAKQRDVVVSSTRGGELLFQQATKFGKPVALLSEGFQPVVNVTATFAPQEYFSEITAHITRRKRRKGKPARKGSKYTEDNPNLLALRPLSFKVPDTDDADAPTAAAAKLGRMFANVASYRVDLATWRDPQGDLWEPNTTVSLDAPNAMIYGPFEFLIRTVTLHQDAENSSASLDLVLPGTFGGGLSALDRLPWEDD